MIRIDFIFSYWIFIWYLLYIKQLTNINPKFALICGLIENIIIMLLMIIYKTNYKLFIEFIIMFIILKIIPLYTITTSIKLYDIYYTIGIFIIYLIWMILNKQTLNSFIKNIIDIIIYNKNTLIGMKLLDKLIF